MKNFVLILFIIQLLAPVFNSCNNSNSRIEFSGYMVCDTINYNDFNEEFSSKDSILFEGTHKLDKKLEVFTYNNVITYLNYKPLTVQECLDYKTMFEKKLGFEPKLNRSLFRNDTTEDVRWYLWNDSIHGILYSIVIEDKNKSINPNVISIGYDESMIIKNE